MLQNAQKEVKTAEKEEREQGTAVTVAETSLKHATDQRGKAEKKVVKYEKQPEKWEDLDLEVKAVEIKDQTRRTKEEIKDTETRQKETQKNITDYEGNMLTLSVMLKEEAAAFTDEDVEKINESRKTMHLNLVRKTSRYSG